MSSRSFRFVSDKVLNLDSLKERVLEVRRELNSAVIARTLAVVLVISLAVGLRVWGLNRTGFNTDERSVFFSDRLFRFAKRYHSRVIDINRSRVPFRWAAADKPVMIAYEVRP